MHNHREKNAGEIVLMPISRLTAIYLKYLEPRTNSGSTDIQAATFLLTCLLKVLLYFKLINCNFKFTLNSINFVNIQLQD